MLPNPVSEDRATRWAGRAAAAVAMLAMGWAFRCNHLTDWDSWDYAAQAIMGHSSDLALGRWWFLAAMRGAYGAGAAIFGLERAEAFLPMQAVSAIMMAGAVVAGMAWARRLAGRESAELLFAAMVVLGPIIGLYTFSVMTEGMTLLFLSLALWAWEVARQAPRRAGLWALAAGLAFGVALDVREPVLAVGAWPLLSCVIDRRPKQWRLLALAGTGAALTLGIGVLGAWAWYPWKGMEVRRVLGRDVDVSYFKGIENWKKQMDAERAQYPVSIPRNLACLFKYGVSAAAPTAFLAVPAAVWAAFRWRRGLFLAAGLLPLAILLVLDHTLVVNPRHPLPLVWLLTPLAAVAWDRWLGVVFKDPRRRLRVGLAVVLTSGAIAISYGYGSAIFQEEYYDYVGSIQRAYLAMRRLPKDAVVVAGMGTPAAYYLNRTKETQFEIIASGWAWPPDISQEIEDRLQAGRTVYVYYDLNVWSRSARKSGEWDVLAEVVPHYAQSDRVGPLVRVSIPRPRPPAPASSLPGPAATAPRPLP